MVANAQSCFTFLAAGRESAARQCATFGPLLDYRPHRTFTAVLPHRPKTRVGGFHRHASGQTSRRGRGRSINTPGSRACAYKTASGRHEWPSRDPIGERGGINVTSFAGNDLVNSVDLAGLLIKCKCPEDYFKHNGLTGKYKQDSHDPTLYSADNEHPFRGLGIGEIIWNMLQTSRIFTARDLDAKQLELQVTARQNVISRIASVKWEMARDIERKYNHNFWDPLMVPKKGVNWASAINDPFVNPDEYQTGCNRTSMLILLEGTLDTVGASVFNDISTQGIPEISGAAQHADLIRVDNVTPGKANPTVKDWVPGDRGYIDGKGTGTGLAAGEWIIYVGNGNWWGFYPGKETSNDQPIMAWMKDVNNFAHGNAEETGQRWYPGVGLQ